MVSPALATAMALVCLCAVTYGAGGDNAPSSPYLDETIHLLQQVEAKTGAIMKAGDTVAEHMAAGHALYLGGSYEGFIIEAYYRAGGMMKAARLTDTAKLKPGDVLLLGTVEEAAAVDTALIGDARRRGALVVRIGPGALCGTGNDLPDIDLGLPCPGASAAREAKQLPLASVGDTMVLWALTGEIVSGLTRRGKMTPMFQSVLVPGGRERNAEHLKLDWEPTCPQPQRAGVLGRTYLAHLSQYLHALRATQLAKFGEAGQMCREAQKAGKRVFVIPFGHLPPYEVQLVADPGVFVKLDQGTDGKKLAQVVKAGDVVLYVGYYELPVDILQAAHDAGAKIVSFVSGTPERSAAAMGADVSIDACWRFGDAAVQIPGYDVAILPPSGVMAGVGYWMLVEAATTEPKVVW